MSPRPVKTLAWGSFALTMTLCVVTLVFLFLARHVPSLPNEFGPKGFAEFLIRDDGRGFDPTTTPRGAGLQNMADRLAAVDGALEVRSTVGDGTTIAGRIPASMGIG